MEKDHLKSVPVDLLASISQQWCAVLYYSALAQLSKDLKEILWNFQQYFMVYYMVLFRIHKNLSIYPFHPQSLLHKCKTSRFPCFTIIHISLSKGITFPCAFRYLFVSLYSYSTTTAQRQNSFFLHCGENSQTKKNASFYPMHQGWKLL